MGCDLQFGAGVADPVLHPSPLSGELRAELLHQRAEGGEAGGDHAGLVDAHRALGGEAQDKMRHGDAMVAMWGTGEYQHVLNPDMPWNEEIRATWARMERLAASSRTLALMMPLTAEMDVRAVLATVRVPTLVVQHTDDPLITPAMSKDVADHIDQIVKVAGIDRYSD